MWTTEISTKDGDEAASSEMDRGGESMVERMVETFSDQGGFGFDVSFTA